MVEIERVEGAVDVERLGIRQEEGSGARHIIYYDDVPLWYTAVPIEHLDIFLYDGSQHDEPYSLFCRDGYGDIYTYGMWDTKEEALAWLENPTRLH